MNAHCMRKFCILLKKKYVIKHPSSKVCSSCCMLVGNYSSFMLLRIIGKRSSNVTRVWISIRILCWDLSLRTHGVQDKNESLRHLGNSKRQNRDFFSQKLHRHGLSWICNFKADETVSEKVKSYSFRGAYFDYNFPDKYMPNISFYKWRIRLCFYRVRF